jgi:hypothetical protein
VPTEASYNEDAAGVTWPTFLEEILPNEAVREYLRRVVGLLLPMCHGGDYPDRTEPSVAAHHIELSA